MDDPTVIIVFLEVTLYFAYVQLVRRDRRRNAILFIVLTLHLSQRRLAFNVLDQFSFFDWGVIQVGTTSQSATEPDVSQAEQRICDCSRFNVSNAIGLHNELVEYVLSRAPELASRVQKDWFSVHSKPEWGLSGADILPRLSPPVIEFLTGIYAWDDLGTFSLTPHVRGVAWPEFVSPDPESAEGELFYDTMSDCIVLYRSDVHDSDARGLVFDQCTCLARFLPSIWDEPGESYWAPLEDILIFWLEEARSGRWIVDPAREGDMHGPPTAWRHLSWIPEDVEQVVSFWEAYISLVTAKARLSQTTETFVPILSDSSLDTAGIDGFSRSLLSRMRRPPFTLVAPGMRIPDEATLLAAVTEAVLSRTQQLYEDDDPPDLSFPLFHNLASNSSGIDPVKPYTAPLWLNANTPWGVHIDPSPSHADAVSIYAPRTERNRTFALVEQYRGVVGATLLKPGREYVADAACGRRPLRLHQLIARWYDLVVTGRWGVGPEGVEGAVERVWDAMPREWAESWH